MKLKKKEALLFGIIFLAAIAAWIATRVHTRQAGDYGSIHITVKGEDFGTYSLGKDQKIRINGTNTCRIKDGNAKMIEATCPDHLCIHQAAIDERGGMIICLPNEVIIEGIPSAQAQTGDLMPDIVAG